MSQRVGLGGYSEAILNQFQINTRWQRRFLESAKNDQIRWESHRGTRKVEYFLLKCKDGTILHSSTLDSHTTLKVLLKGEIIDFFSP